jgi:hypothetical protein
MAKRQRKTKTEAERAEIEADRVAAAEGTGPYAQEVVEYLSAPLDAEVTEEQDAALEEVMSVPESTSDELNDMVDEVVAEAETEAEGNDEEERIPNSIVKPKFKNKYAANAAAIGDTRKQVKRSNWDWLSQQLAAFCLNDKGKIDIGAFTDVLEANGIDHSKWTNRNKGWEGRFRMTGRVALQKVVANSGSLAWPNGEPTVAPPEWCEQYKTKA